MRSKSIKIALIFTVILILLSCKSIYIIPIKTFKIINATKASINEGMYGGKSYMHYEILIQSNSEFKINNIMIGEGLISNAKAQNIKTQQFLDVQNTNIPAGKYKLLFKSSEAFKGDNNVITLELNIKDRTKTISSRITKDKRAFYAP